MGLQQFKSYRKNNHFILKMKALFYYLFGIVTALYVAVFCFDAYAPVFLDDYYLEKLTREYAREWYNVNMAIAIIGAVFALVWAWNLGKGTNHEKKEPLLTKEEKEDE